MRQSNSMLVQHTIYTEADFGQSFAAALGL